MELYKIGDNITYSRKIKQAAEYLSISPASLRRLIKRGLIKPNLALRHVLIPVVELDRFLTGGQR
jgi:hypothetical protein